MPSLEQELRRYVIDNFLYGRQDQELSDDDSFVDKGVLDSTGVLDLVGYLEQSYGVEIADQELVPENLDSVRRIAAFLRAKRGENGRDHDAD